MRTSSLLAVAAALFMSLGLLPGGTARAQAPVVTIEDGTTNREIDVPAGQFVTLRTGRPFGRSAIGDPSVATLIPTSDRSLNLLGNAPGMTNAQIFDQNGALIASFTVEVGADTGDLRRAIRQAHPDAKVQVQLVNGQLRLSGTVPDAPALSDILDLAAQYGSQQVINALEVEASQQVMLEVRFIEASRTAGRELGVSISASQAGTSGDTGLFTNGGLTGTPFGTLLIQVLNSGLNADILIEALEDKGLARRLAEPNLIARSGATASFLAGGEIPIPVAEDEGTITVTYKEFGVRLNFTPIVLGDSLISLTMEHEVSQVDPTMTVRTGVIEVPGFITRRAKTEIDLRDGQSFAVAGLLQVNNVKTQDQVPYIGQIPVLGALFRSSSFQKEETDLVIIVTPRLVQPAGPGTPLKTPASTRRPSNDAEFFLLGMMEVDDEMLAGFASGKGLVGPYGHIIELSPEALNVVKN